MLNQAVRYVIHAMHLRVEAGMPNENQERGQDTLRKDGSEKKLCCLKVPSAGLQIFLFSPGEVSNLNLCFRLPLRF